jgi:hypothetical protein
VRYGIQIFRHNVPCMRHRPADDRRLRLCPCANDDGNRYAARHSRELALKSVGFDINDENYPNSLQQSLRKLEAMEARHEAEAGAAVQGSEKPAMPSVPQ